MADSVPVREVAFRIHQAALLNEDVFRIQLDCLDPDRPSFLAGQYLLALVPGAEPCAFSIASEPAALRQHGRVELHFRAQSGNPGSDAFRRLIEGQSSLHVRLPFGTCCIDDPPANPVLLVAGSTGFAQVKSMAEHLLRAGFKQELHLYWGGRRAGDLYLADLPRRWSEEHAHVTFHPVLSEAHEGPQEDLRDGWLHQAILEDFPRLDHLQVYVSGSPGMVYSVYDSLKPHGASRRNFHSDVFEYAPRPEES